MTSRNVSRQRVHAAWASGPLAVVLGVTAHSLSGGLVPGPGVLMAAAALLSMAATILARLRIPAWVLWLASGLAQQVLHLVFFGFSGGSESTPRGHSHGMLVWLPPEAAQAADGHQALELMLNAHVAAAMMTVLVLTRAGVLVSRVSATSSVRRTKGGVGAGG
ncbi:MAG TPA: hypothetical protein VD841_03645 [Arthrobacter sp.]|nr:hypothetical protein [Arthrobacter sp.]